MGMRLLKVNDVSHDAVLQIKQDYNFKTVDETVALLIKIFRNYQRSPEMEFVKEAIRATDTYLKTLEKIEPELKKLCIRSFKRTVSRYE